MFQCEYDEVTYHLSCLTVLAAWDFCLYFNHQVGSRLLFQATTVAPGLLRRRLLLGIIGILVGKRHSLHRQHHLCFFVSLLHASSWIDKWILFSALIKLQVYFINWKWALSNRIILLTSADYEIYRKSKEHFCHAVGKILLSNKSQELSKILFHPKNRIA